MCYMYYLAAEMPRQCTPQTRNTLCMLRTVNMMKIYSLGLLSADVSSAKIKCKLFNDSNFW